MTSFWTKAAAQARLRTCDIIQAEFGADAGDRRAGPREPLSPLEGAASTPDLLRERIAEELEYAGRLLNVMGDELANDRVVVVRHASALQSVDVVSQMLGHIATIVRANDPNDVIDSIGMTELKARLTRRSAL